MKVNIRRIEQAEGGQTLKGKRAFVIWADAFDGWRKMGHDEWNVVQSNWVTWRELGMWRWYRENPDEMYLRLYAKDELDAFQKVVNWREDTSLPE